MSDLEKVAAAIEKLSMPDKLRLAAQLLEAKKASLAHNIIERVSTELGAALLLAKGRG